MSSLVSFLRWLNLKIHGLIFYRVVSEDSMKLLLRDIAFSLDLTDQQRISISPGNVSVTFLIGLPGSGRTTLSLQAARTLERAPYYVATFYVSCGKLAEKKVSCVVDRVL